MRFALSLGLLLAALVAQASGSPGRDAQVLASATAAQGYEIVELVRGAALHGANGTFVGPDGHLYVASFFAAEIVAIDVESGEVVRRYGPEDGVLGPDDVTFGPDGSMYWTDIMVGEVGRRAPDGTVTKQFVAPGVNPITFSPDGRLLVGLCFAGDGLYELDPELIAPPRPIVVASEENPFPLGFFNAFAFGPDGRLYGPLYAADMFISFDVDSCEASSNPWNECDVRVLASGFLTPVAAKFDAHGVLHVLDQWTGELFTVDLETGERALVAELGQGLDNLAFAADGRLYVTNADDGSVVEVLAGGAVRTLSPGGLVLPGGVTVLERPGGEVSLFVADTFRLWEFDAAAGDLVAFTKGSLIGVGMAPPNTVRADGDRLILTSLNLGRVAGLRRALYRRPGALPDGTSLRRLAPRVRPGRGRSPGGRRRVGERRGADPADRRAAGLVPRGSRHRRRAPVGLGLGDGDRVAGVVRRHGSAAGRPGCVRTGEPGGHCVRR